MLSVIMLNVVFYFIFWRHYTQHNDIHHNVIQHHIILIATLSFRAALVPFMLNVVYVECPKLSPFC
jgi:hypothetical protein